MADPQQALRTQLANIEKKTGRSLDALAAAIAGCGTTKHGEIRAWLMDTYGLGFGDANTVIHVATRPAEAPSADDALAAIYTGAKAHLRPIHDAVLAVASGLGPFEIAPKKGYVSLRRAKQFAMIGPKSATRVELGLNLKADISSARIAAAKPGGMCQFAVSLTSPADVDAEIAAALAKAFEQAG